MSQPRRWTPRAPNWCVTPLLIYALKNVQLLSVPIIWPEGGDLGGYLVAQGTPQELKNRLLGDPMMELRVVGTLNGLVDDLSERVNVVSAGQDWVRYTVANPHEFNPSLLQTLSQQKVPVVTLSEVPRSLEEIYLRIVETDTNIDQLAPA